MKKNGNQFLNKKRKKAEKLKDEEDDDEIISSEENESIEEDSINEDQEIEEYEDEDEDGEDDYESEENEGEEIEEESNENDSENEEKQTKTKRTNLNKKLIKTQNKIPSEISNNAKKGKSITVQKQIFDMIIGLRIGMQKIFKNSNTFSNNIKIAKYISDIFANKEERKIKIVIHSLKSFFEILLSYFNLLKSLCGKGNLYNQKNLDISAIDNLLEEIHKEIESLNKFKPISTKENNNNLSSNLNNKPDFDGEYYLVSIEKSILRTFENVEIIFENISKLYYAVFNIWHKKTLAYDNNRKSKFGDNSLNIFNFSENISKYLDLNLKKILSKYIVSTNAGNNKENSEEKLSDLIYSYQDDDFYNNLLKDIISEKDQNSNEDTYSKESRFDYTYNYLLNKSQKNKKKIVDTKASKNRKLRFDAHEKLINFMVPIENLNIHIGRDAFIKSIFGLNRKINQNDVISKIEGLSKNFNRDDYNEENDIDII